MCAKRSVIAFAIAGLFIVYRSPSYSVIAQQANHPQAGPSGSSRIEKEPSPSVFITSPTFGRGVSEWWRNADVQRRLELRPGQIADIERSWKQHVTGARPVREVLSRKWQAIDQAITDQTVTPEELKQMFMIAESLRSDVNTSRVVALYRIFLILDPIQRTALNEWLKRSSVDATRGRSAN